MLGQRDLRRGRQPGAWSPASRPRRSCGSRPCAAEVYGAAHRAAPLARSGTGPACGARVRPSSDGLQASAVDQRLQRAGVGPRPSGRPGRGGGCRSTRSRRPRGRSRRAPPPRRPAAQGATRPARGSRRRGRRPGRARRRPGARGSAPPPAGRRAPRRRRRRPPAASGRSRRARRGRGRGRRPAPPAPSGSAGSSPAAARSGVVAPAEQDREGHAAQEPARRRLGRVQVAVGVDPHEHQVGVPAAQAGGHRRRQRALAEERERVGRAAHRVGKVRQPRGERLLGRRVEVEVDPPPRVRPEHRRDRGRPLLHPGSVEPARPRRHHELAPHRSASRTDTPATSARSSS